MEKKIEGYTQILNELLKINNDRIEGYKKVLKEVNDYDLRSVLVSLLEESKKFEVELALEILKHGGTPLVGSSTLAGKVYRFWIEVKEIFTGKDRSLILRACEFAEEEVRKTCKRALQHIHLTSGMKQQIRNQQAAFRISYDAVNGYGNMKISLK